MVDRIDIDTQALERSQARYVRCQQRGYHAAIFDEVTDRALDGQALRFNKLFNYKGDLMLFRPGSLGDVAAKDVEFCIDHLESSASASTKDGSFELMVDDDSVQFRVDLSKACNGSILSRMCSIGNRDAVSVGCDIYDESKQEIGGKRVRVVRRARLKEISLCEVGAVEDAFAMLVDTKMTPKPVAGQVSATMKAGKMLHKVHRQIKAMKRSFAEQHGQPHAKIVRTMTINQSNRMQTEETEALQQQARGMHGLHI